MSAPAVFPVGTVVEFYDDSDGGSGCLAAGVVLAGCAERDCEGMILVSLAGSGRVVQGYPECFDGSTGGGGAS
jgi:hypothetical protein